MPEDLKQRLEKKKKINGRSLNSEVVARLQASLGKQQHFRAEDAGGGYTVSLSDPERQLLAIFKRLSPEKQLALISLFS